MQQIKDLFMYYIFFKLEDQDLKVKGPLDRDLLIKAIKHDVFENILWISAKNICDVDWGITNYNIGVIVKGSIWCPMPCTNVVDAVVVSDIILVRNE